MRAFSFLLILLLFGGVAQARALRPRFEPDDLELEAPGTVEVNLQFGGIYGGDHYWRGVVPDLEVDVGILPSLELDVNWTYATEGRGRPSAVDNVWISSKLGLFAVRGADESSPIWAIGLQTGPHLPAIAGATGLGWESLVMIGRMTKRAQLVLSLGGVVEPPLANHRQVGLEAGLTLDLPLDKRQHFGFSSSLAGVLFASQDASQLTLNAGFNYSPTDTTQISLTAVVGFTPASDRFGVLIGIAQKVRRRTR